MKRDICVIAFLCGFSAFSFAQVKPLLPDSIIGYVPNYFTVRLPFYKGSKNGDVNYSSWGIRMNIEKWIDGSYA
ncbi:MAG: hypothetical protein NTV01_09710, partial [Bacteroidia bacterium]|nr:hypothetical protein [Bacteroidia bacterium]